MGEAKVDDNGELGTARYKVLQALDMRRSKLLPKVIQSEVRSKLQM